MKRTRPRRVSINLPVTYENLGIFLDSEIMNLSKGGLFLKADIPLPLRSRIDFKFSLPELSKTIEATGLVVWSRGYSKSLNEPSGMGIQFLDISTGDIEAILDYIERLIRDE
jgi:uncharacterized protein (TIGR02266 family)